jgi:hypothetical protein
VFEGLIAKAVKMSLRPLSATLNRTLVAAGAPTISPEPDPVGPVLSPAQTTVVTATWTHYVDNELFPYLAQTFVDAAGAVRAGTEAALDVSVPPVTDSYAVAYLAAASNRLVNVGDVVWSAVRDQLVEGYAAGESTHQLAARVREVAGFTRHRAVAVARTEVVGAANAGSLAQLQLAGFTDEECSKRWLATEDERTRIAHHVADGQTVPLNQPFSVGGEGLQFPGDPRGRADNIIQCRCTLEYVFADDAEPLNASIDPRQFRWIEDDHPRIPNGEFTDKFDWLTPNEADDMHRQMIASVPWTHSQYQALSDYAGSSYKPINMHLRGEDTTPSDRTVQQVREIYRAMRPTTRDVKVQRAVYADAFQGMKTAGDLEKMIGRTFEERGFLSTTMSRDFVGSGVYKREGAPVLLELDVPTGTLAAYLGGNSGPGIAVERELLLDKGTRFVITHVSEELNPQGQKTFVVHGKVTRPLTAAGIHQAKHAVEKAFDELKHPRAPKGAGHGHGGEFVKKSIGVGQVQALAPIKINTKVVYSTKYTHNAVVAQRVTKSGARQELRWNDQKQKFEVWSDYGVAGSPLAIAQVLGKGQTYQKFGKDDTEGWTAPGPTPPTRLGLTEWEKSLLPEKDWGKELQKMKDLEALSKPSPKIPRTSSEAIQAVKDMSGPEFVQFMEEHFGPDGDPDTWNYLDDEEKKTLKDKALDIQTNPQSKGFGKYDQSYLAPFGQILDLEQGNDQPSGNALNELATELNDMTTEDFKLWLYDHVYQESWESLIPDAEKDVIWDATVAHGSQTVTIFNDLIKGGSGNLDEQGNLGSDPLAVANLGTLSVGNLLKYFNQLEINNYKTLSATDRGKLDIYADMLETFGYPSVPVKLKNFKNGFNYQGSFATHLNHEKLSQHFDGMSPAGINEWYDTLTPQIWENLSDQAKESALLQVEFQKHSMNNPHPDQVLSKYMFGDVGTPSAHKKLPLGPPGTGQTSGWPDPKNLKFSGQIVGTHGSQIYYDIKTSKKYLFKPTPEKLDFTVEADIAVSKLQKKLDIPGPELRPETINGVYGSLQELLPSDPAFPGKFDAKQLSASEINKLIAAQAFDWLISQHDSHAENFLISKEDGQLIAIDKTQAFKFFPYDQLSSEFQPNEHPTIYSQLWKAFEQGQVNVPSPTNGNLGPGMELWDMQHMPNDEFKAILRPYAEAAAKRGRLMNPNVPQSGPSPLLAKTGIEQNNVEQFLDLAVKRKNNLLDDFNAFYQKELQKRQANGFGGYKPPSVTQVAPQNVPKLVKAQPLKLTTTFIYKTPHPIGVPIAERALPSGLNQQLRWNGKNYELWGNKTGIFKFEVAMGKGATYEQLGKSDLQGWMTPGTPSQPGVSTPNISSPGQVAATATQKVTEIPKISKFDAATIQSQYGGIDSIQSDFKTQIYEKFKKGTSLGTITLKSTAPTTFKALALAAADWNQAHPTFESIKMLQLLKIVDEKLTPAGSANQNLYEKKIVDWLGTAGGKKNAPGFVNWAEATVAQTKKLGTAQPSVSGKIYTVDDILKIKLGTPSTTPGTQFPTLTLGDASAMHKKMQGKVPWTADQITAIKKYTGSYYSEMNAALRHKPDYTGSIMKDAYNLQTAMRPVPQDFIVHRGTGMKQFGVTTPAQLKQLIGQTVVDRGFMSTSVGGQAART